MKQFVLRPYNEEKDMPFFYEKFCEHERNTFLHILWGASLFKSMESVKVFLRDYAFDYQFKVIADSGTNEAVGWVYSLDYNLAAKHETLTLEYCGDEEQTKCLLCQLFEQRFENPYLHMIIFEVEGYKNELIKACGDLGTIQVGVIEDHVVYGDPYPLHVMTMTGEGWDKVKTKG